MNISSVIDYLNEKYGFDLDSAYYTYIDVWKKWWEGYYEPFHEFQEVHGKKRLQRKLYSLKMGKKVCEDWASILMNDRTKIIAADNQNQEFLFGKDQTGGICGEVAFWHRENELIEKAFATGTGAVVLRFENLLVNGGAVQPEQNSRICADYLPAENIIPLTVNAHGVQDVAFASEALYLGNRYTYLSTHRLEPDGYVIRNAYFSDDEGVLKPESLPQGMIEEYRTGSGVPLFSLISPNIVKNLSGGEGLGLSVLANAIDELQGIDLAFNNFCRDFKLGGKKVFYNQSLTRTDAQGQTITPDDIAQQLFYQIGENDSLGDDNKPITEYNPSLRVEENEKGVQAMLDYLSFRVGFGTKHYQFNGGSIVTATQYTGDKQDLVQNAAKHYIAVENHVKQIVRALLWAGKNVQGLPLDPDDMVTIEFDDSYIIDKEAERERDRQDVRDGLMQKWEYRVKWYGEDEKTAKAMTEADAKPFSYFEE